MNTLRVYMAIGAILLFLSGCSPATTVAPAPDLAEVDYVGVFPANQLQARVPISSVQAKLPTRIFMADIDPTTFLAGTSVAFASVESGQVVFDLKGMADSFKKHKLIPDYAMTAGGAAGSLLVGTYEWIGSYADNVSNDAQQFELRDGKNSKRKGQFVYFSSRVNYVFVAGGYDVNIRAPIGVAFAVTDSSVSPKKVYLADPVGFVVTDNLTPVE